MDGFCLFLFLFFFFVILLCVYFEFGVWEAFYIALRRLFLCLGYSDGVLFDTSISFFLYAHSGRGSFMDRIPRWIMVILSTPVHVCCSVTSATWQRSSGRHMHGKAYGRPLPRLLVGAEDALALM